MTFRPWEPTPREKARDGAQGRVSTNKYKKSGQEFRNPYK
jgi:hypothetical protein